MTTNDEDCIGCGATKKVSLSGLSVRFGRAVVCDTNDPVYDWVANVQAFDLPEVSANTQEYTDFSTSGGTRTINIGQIVGDLGLTLNHNPSSAAHKKLREDVFQNTQGDEHYWLYCYEIGDELRYEFLAKAKSHKWAPNESGPMAAEIMLDILNGSMNEIYLA